MFEYHFHIMKTQNVIHGAETTRKGDDFFQGSSLQKLIKLLKINDMPKLL